jgi:phosphatidylserine decarboxylase
MIMKLDRAGIPFVSAALAPAAALMLARRPLLAVPFVVAGGFFAYFFRDPERVVPALKGAVVAPADGRVVVAGDAVPDSAPEGDWQQISIFLSPLDVHVNRIPVSGTIVRVKYFAGSFLPAYRPDASANERNEVWIDHEGSLVVCRQVVGILARRIVCRVQAGARVATGERFGLMKFGSRVDLFLPARAALHATVGQRVRGGETILATM